MKNNRRKPETGLTTNGCPKADNVVCECGKVLTPYAYERTLFGGYKYHYKCSCNKKYSTKK